MRQSGRGNEGGNGEDRGESSSAGEPKGSAALRLHGTREAAAAEGAIRGGEAARFWAYMFPAHGGKIFCFEY